MQEIGNKIEFGYENLDEAFPAADPGVAPFGSRVLVQIRTPKKKTKGGIILTSDVRETEHYNTQVAKVIAVGSLAFKNRNTMEPWPEGSWCAVGEYVRVPRYGGDRWSVKTDGGEDEAILVIFNDLDLVGKVTGDPMAIKAFL
jgi:co-chaperonin GroES (HSP10)